MDGLVEAGREFSARASLDSDPLLETSTTVAFSGAFAGVLETGNGFVSCCISRYQNQLENSVPRRVAVGRLRGSTSNVSLISLLKCLSDVSSNCDRRTPSHLSPADLNSNTAKSERKADSPVQSSCRIHPIDQMSDFLLKLPGPSQRSSGAL